MEKTSILIPTRFDNRWPLTLTIESIRKYTECPYEIIVGDAGMEGEVIDYLKGEKDIQICPCPDPIRPKDTLVRFAQTPYMCVVHDDIQILKRGWLKRRLEKLESAPNVGIVGPMSTNYMPAWRRFFPLTTLHKRFFPLGMVIRKKTQDHLELKWGIEKGFDTGGIAYLQFCRQKKWKFINYPFNEDIKHWAQMTWVLKKRAHTTLNVDDLQAERQKKVEMIKDILARGEY